MRKTNLLVLISFLFIVVFSCDKKGKKQEETILRGEATILVDETLLPIIDDQKQVFENQYNATITLVAKSESEIVQILSKNKQQLAVLSRELTENEAEIFKIKKITPRITPLATDAIAFISFKSNKDTLIDLEKVIAFVQGKDQSNFKGLVFDNPNSSTVRYIKELAKINDLPKQKIFSFQTNNEVIEFVAKNEGMIGIVGVNWLLQPSPKMKEKVGAIKVLSVKSLKTKSFVKPSQDNIATGFYPLTREIKMLNYQPFSGLGMGFASFVSGEIGQRIILKSGLVPAKIPNRNLIIRKEITKK
ncbi:substrate-binding domain-containing protein [Flavobacterium psychrophilum]|nr:substrate-binding domain-containing protein [Flavobacterium psychrophilum]QZL00302.1 substrate-binding domain-containing protein [Flavobacterium psychrophilum]SNB17809.1 putative ABC-type phosphate-transport system, binding lipoprotein component [Flavobacterium psychrophilum]SNB24895.1 putative ABC-type phosphate-transport system, binding lipoprotein component [Flavobacterium psychrophilum]